MAFITKRRRIGVGGFLRQTAKYVPTMGPTTAEELLTITPSQTKTNPDPTPHKEIREIPDNLNMSKVPIDGGIKDVIQSIDSTTVQKKKAINVGIPVDKKQKLYTDNGDATEKFERNIINEERKEAKSDSKEVAKKMTGGGINEEGSESSLKLGLASFDAPEPQTDTEDNGASDSNSTAEDKSPDWLQKLWII